MAFGRTKDLTLYENTKEKGRKFMAFRQTKDLECYEKEKKTMGLGRTNDLELYEYTLEKAEKSWGFAELKIFYTIHNKAIFTKQQMRIANKRPLWVRCQDNMRIY